MAICTETGLYLWALWFLFSGEQNGALTLKLWIALMGLDDDKL